MGFPFWNLYLFTLFGSVIITHDLLAVILDSSVIMMVYECVWVLMGPCLIWQVLVFISHNCFITCVGYIYITHQEVATSSCQIKLSFLDWHHSKSSELTVIQSVFCWQPFVLTQIIPSHTDYFWACNKFLSCANVYVSHFFHLLRKKFWLVM